MALLGVNKLMNLSTLGIGCKGVNILQCLKANSTKYQHYNLLHNGVISSSSVIKTFCKASYTSTSKSNLLTNTTLNSPQHYLACRHYASWDDGEDGSDKFPVFQRPERRRQNFDDYDNRRFNPSRDSRTRRQNNNFSENNYFDEDSEGNETERITFPRRSNNQRSPRYSNFDRPSKYRNNNDDDGGDRDFDFSSNRFAPRQPLGANIKKRDWDTTKLSPIEKNFYVLHSDVAGRSQESLDEYYSKHNITVSRGERPMPLSDFHEANFPDKIVKYLESNSWSNPTPIQSMGWPIALSGKNMVGLAQTGSGKTLGFILPALVHIKHQRPVDRGEGPVVLVLAPTRELAQQIKGVAKEYGRLLGISSCSIFGGQSKMVQARHISQGPELVVATPGRLLDFIESEVMELNRTTFVVLDEADRMLDMGFEPQIRKILGQVRPDRQILMWSATWPKEIQKLAHDFLGEFTQINIGSQELTANPNIEQVVKVCEYREKFGLLLDELNAVSSEDQRTPKTLIFGQTKRVVDVITNKLRNRRLRASAIHGDKTQAYRDDALHGFRKGHTDILVATDVAARGLDVDDIKVVINYDYPNSIDDYIHRIGRTGRASKTGKAVTFVTDDDAPKVRDLIKTLEAADQEVDPALQDMVRFYGKINKKSSPKFGGNQRYRKPSSGYNNYHRRGGDDYY